MKYIVLAFLLLFCVNSVFAQQGRDIPVNIDSRIKTLIYNPNEIYSLDLKMGFQTIIEFSIDESIELISVGEPYPWKLTPVDRRLFVKPIQIGAHTNLTVITNKRVYLFDLSSDASPDSNNFDVTHVVRFFYPQIPLDQSKYSMENYLAYKGGKAIDPTSEMQEAESVGNTTLNNANSETGTERVAVNLNYSFVGEYNEITPIEIFDDRKDTFFRFKANDKPPRVYSIANNGVRKLMPQKRIGDFIVIPGVHTKFHIKDGVYENYIYNDLKINKSDDS